MKINKHIISARRGIENRFKELYVTANERDLIIGILAGLSGEIDGVRRLKIDSSARFGIDKHYKARELLEDFLHAYPARQAKSYTHYAAAAVCWLYNNGKLTKTVNPLKDEKPFNPVALVNDASTGPADELSEINLKVA